MPTRLRVVIFALVFILLTGTLWFRQFTPASLDYKIDGQELPQTTHKPTQQTNSSISLSQSSPRLLWSWEPVLNDKGVIFGAVTMPDKLPIPGDLLISLHRVPVTHHYNPNIDTVIETVDVGADGKYMFNGLSVGTYYLLGDSKYYSGSTTVFVKSYPSQHPRYSVPYETEASLELDRNSYLSGTVITPQGDPVDNASVFLVGTNRWGSYHNLRLSHAWPYTVRTDADGYFKLSSLEQPIESAMFKLMAVAQGYAPTVTQEFAGGTENLEIVLTEGVTLNGVLLDENTNLPLPDARLKAESRYAGGTVFTRSNKDGSFTFPNMALGTYRLNLIDNESVIANTAYELKVSNNSDKEAVNIATKVGATIEGRVYDDDSGAGVSGVAVFAQAMYRNPSRYVFTDNEGRYQIQGLHPDTFQLSHRLTKGFMPIYGENAKTIENIPDQSRVKVDFPVFQGATIAGKITDENGEPISGAYVDLSYNKQSTEGRLINIERSQILSKSDGVYEATGLFKGSYDITFSAPDYVPDYLTNIDSDTAAVNGLLRRPGFISGRVIDKVTREPVTRFRVHVDGDIRDLDTDGLNSLESIDGNFTAQYNSLDQFPKVLVEATGYELGFLQIDQLVRSGETHKGLVIELQPR